MATVGLLVSTAMVMFRCRPDRTPSASRPRCPAPLLLLALLLPLPLAAGPDDGRPQSAGSEGVSGPGWWGQGEDREEGEMEGWWGGAGGRTGGSHGRPGSPTPVGCCCCECWNTTGDEAPPPPPPEGGPRPPGTNEGLEVECRCSGDALRLLPADLDPLLRTLTIAQTAMESLHRDSFKAYRESLRDVVLMEMTKLQTIEPGIFRHMKHLRTIYISQAPALKALSPGIFRGISSSLYTLRIAHTGLEEVPDLRGIGSGIMKMVDLENNGIKEVRSNSIRVKAEHVLLNHNAIKTVAGWAFNGSEIAKLSLKGNRALTTLSPEAFAGLQSLREIDLSMTSITQLPTMGLEELDVLRLVDTTTLKVIPSVYSFKHLQEAWLTYSFHCCAFQFPARHNPKRHALHQAYLARIRETCNETAAGSSRGRRRAPTESPPEGPHPGGGSFGPPFPIFELGGGALGWGLNGTAWDAAPRGERAGERALEPQDEDDDGGFFHQTTATLPPTQLEAICGNLFDRKEAVRCYPSPDAFNPCEDIMGRAWLRAAVWAVVVTSVAGNLAVLLVLLSARFRMSVSKFLMCNLAVADLCMGLYLLLIATMDARTIGVYFNYAFDWQYGPGCQVAGFITVFASQLSVFTLSILTLERWFAITYAMYLNKRLKLPAAAKVMAGGWLYALTMASLPLLGISGYSTTSICLPMDTSTAADVVYVSALLVANCLAFALICACYARIYFSLDKDTRREMTVAKRMALLVFTDFACWAPIAFFGLTAVAGMPLIDVTRSKILLVFFYPLNSCANPYLYAILTKQYRRDLFILLSRYGMCKRTAQRHKVAGSGFFDDPGAAGSGSARHRGHRGPAGASFDAEDLDRAAGASSCANGASPLIALELRPSPTTGRPVSLPVARLENGAWRRAPLERRATESVGRFGTTQEVYL
ncbi:lutropin-choriogonadotropic hormone receptor-like [Hetaerina americana]|uniref:lutropin-choriogonadotropic hormone receptor-like n=1 Tax=Hetaerina americana TaxID=62018 RepID=UPI003A7F3363